jgi:hypothetical protein
MKKIKNELMFFLRALDEAPYRSLPASPFDFLFRNREKKCKRPA